MTSTLISIESDPIVGSFLSFKLSDKFINNYVDVEPPFGYRDAAGNSVGELIFIDKYSRLKEDGTKERWHEVCRRVIEGMYSIQKDWIKEHALPWNDNKAQRSAEEAYDLLFNMYWTPPGRGLWSMGTYVVNGMKNSSPLQNCSFISTLDMTKTDPAAPFCFLMDVSMLGVGVGYDTRGASKEFVIYEPQGEPEVFTVPDSREGWVEATRKKINSYLIQGKQPVIIDTSLIRPKGAPIRTFGGVAPGPKPLERLMNKIDSILGDRDGELFGIVDIVDIANLVGVCVVSGNVRRSAEIALGDYESKEFLNLKNAEIYPERNSYDPDNPGWAWMSNNSVFVQPGQSYSNVIEGIIRNGEPGLIWLDNVHSFGRMNGIEDKNDNRVSGVNPCSEQFLESGEMCTLADIHWSRIPNALKLRRAIKYAFLYAKTVTLMPTHIPKTNAVMQRNRRIGLSISGIADFVDNHGRAMAKAWMDTGYKFVKEYDEVYSEWLCVRKSIRLTTVKPTGTLGVMIGESPGGHWTPGGMYFARLFRFDKENPVVEAYRVAGYRIEPATEDPKNTVVVYFPIKGVSKRSEREVSIYEKAALAVDLQRYWSDNGVSITLSFDPDKEQEDVPRILEMHDQELKAVSFLSLGKTYPQQPFQPISGAKYDELGSTLNKVDMSVLYNNGQEAAGEAGCTTDVCEVKLR